MDVITHICANFNGGLGKYDYSSIPRFQVDAQGV